MLEPIQIFCASCKQLKWRVTEKQTLFPKESFPISVCFDCEEEILSKLNDFLNKKGTKENE
ncbi:hypothetical protein GZH47_31830 (plasmid) [Paenibacillus rhizovicinus]|uniref:DUF2197 domain-containing protein n=1 Tax=Paenibacillus rhizovicinus TaxID=2704463 RepID=A0A6C0PAA3_9BACL|nr:hypothetical protein [Paenibacillus rhizovicinus]QHW35487.1 hypothetical protein GZH47_31830 [Paenibacillus rhizovicinus]